MLFMRRASRRVQPLAQLFSLLIAAAAAAAVTRPHNRGEKRGADAT